MKKRDTPNLSIFDMSSLALFGILFLLFFVFGIYNKVTAGCFSYDEIKETKFSLIDDYNYTCKQLEGMLTFEVYPHNLNLTETHYYCRGKDVGMSERTLIGLYDIKREYLEKCL